jgi:polysaccharide chain length determinant protein (PEP-CTERM system associated)
MHELVVQLLRYARETWRFRWWMLGIAWTVCVIGWAVVARLPDEYGASARVYVDTQSLLAPMLKGVALQSDSPQRRVALMTRTLFSQPNMEKLLRMTDMDLQADTPAKKESLIAGLQRSLRLAPSGPNLYTISYATHSPEMAKLVVKSLLTIFMESNIGEVRKEQDSANQFVEQQIKDYERRLIEAERDIVLFKKANFGFLPGSSGGYYSRLEQLNQELKAAELQVKIEQDRVETLRKQLSGETPVFDSVPLDIKVNTQDIDRRIQLNEVKLDELLLRYTEKHPDVVSLRRSIGDLKAQRNALIAAAKKDAGASGAGAGADTNPVYQQMQLAVSAAEAEVAAKQAVVAEYRERIKELEAAVDRALKVEADEQQLNRNYNVIKKTHDTLVARLEAAQLARKADTRSETVRFRVVDPPQAPTKPTAPNRLLLSSGVLLAGILLGAAVAFLFGQLRPTFDERKLLNEVTGLAVLGSVDMIWTASQLRARRLRNLSFVGSIFGLFAVYGLVMAVYLTSDTVLSRIASSIGLS